MTIYELALTLLAVVALAGGGLLRERLLNRRDQISLSKIWEKYSRREDSDEDAR